MLSGIQGFSGLLGFGFKGSEFNGLLGFRLRGLGLGFSGLGV